MFIEVLHDGEGAIKGCYCVDTLPGDPGAPLFMMEKIPGGWSQARINVDTIAIMEIEAACRERAVIDPVSGAAVIVGTDRARYIVDNFKVDLSVEHTLPEEVRLPEGLRMRALSRR